MYRHGLLLAEPMLATPLMGLAALKSGSNEQIGWIRLKSGLCLQDAGKTGE